MWPIRECSPSPAPRPCCACSPPTAANLRLGVIAAAAQLPKSTAHGLLQTLVSEDLVEHDSDRGRYRLSTNLTLTDRRRGSL